ncbi:MAG: rRNA pseudouridine synthase [Actinomycetota bacterium]|nr:rRNA pseudouridine synthase [Actinomycetota bacterium]
MSPEGERLQKVLAKAGLGSRRSVEDQIRAGRITVNGRRAVLGQRIDPAKDEVAVDRSRVPLRTDLVYYLFNKPIDVVTTAADTQGRQTVLDYVETPQRVWPVGRLDMDSEGALLLTNDGDLTHRLTHPRFGVPKVYLAYARGTVGNRALKTLARGIRLDDGVTGPARVRLVERRPGETLVEIEVREGRNRQVRRMFESLEHPLKRLVRTAVGPVMLGHLKPGTLRRLAAEETRALYRACRL